jgi:hypothetical protein
MQRVIIAAAAMLLGAGVAVPTAQADQYVGPVVANGMCYQNSKSSEMGFGYWTECPKPAAAPVAHRHPAKHSSKEH